MRLGWRWLALALLPALLAQEPAGPKFDVVSVRRSDPRVVDQGAFGASPSTLVYRGTTVWNLIRTAYRVQNIQIADAPAWLTTEHFDITAKMEKPHEVPEMLAMLQSLLEERFRLAVHREKRVLPHYSVTAVDPGGPRHPGLRRAAEEECNDDRPTAPQPPCGQVRGSGNGPQSRFVATSIPMSQFALAFSNSLYSWVDDNTNLEGNYDITVEWAPEGSDPAAFSGPSVFTAFQQQLGLKIQAVKGPVEVLVIDRVEMPGDN
jgi:uncharacterized protein (TIGR03435 family)